MRPSNLFRYNNYYHRVYHPRIGDSFIKYDIPPTNDFYDTFFFLVRKVLIKTIKLEIYSFKNFSKDINAIPGKGDLITTERINNGYNLNHFIEGYSGTRTTPHYIGNIKNLMKDEII